MNHHLHHSEQPHPPKLLRTSTPRIVTEGKVFPLLGVLNLQLPVVKECYDWIEKFKSGVTKKGKVTFEIYSILTSLGEKSEIVKVAAKSYIKILNQHDLKISRAFKRGRISEGEAPNSPRASCDPSQSSAGSESRASSINSDAAIKKKKVDESNLPWVIQNKLLGVELWPELHATLKLLRAWSINPKQVKLSIVNTSWCPAFPDSEWLNLIRGKSINLDNVFSSFYSTSIDNQCTESIGEIKFKFGTKDISKPVATHGDWTIAFDLTRDAYLFTFVHRAKELKVYQCYILQQFATKWESEHPRVITLDRAIRKWVSKHWDLFLTDLDQFNDLQTMHLDHYGAAELGCTTGSNFAGSSNKSSNRKQSEPCQNWNRGICRCGKNCYYLHVCKLCLKKGHTSDKCPQGKSTASSSWQQGNTAKLGSRPNVDWYRPRNQSCCTVEWKCFASTSSPFRGILECRGYQYHF